MSLNFKAWCDSMTTIRTIYSDTEYLTVSAKLRTLLCICLLLISGFLINLILI
jgi:hypothetical protein